MADTDILLTVGLDTRDADKTAEQLQREVQNIFDSRKGQQSAALTSLESQIKQTYNKATQLREKLRSIGDTPVATERFAKLQKELDGYEKTYYSLIEKMSQFEEAGGDISSDKYQKWVADFERVSEATKHISEHMEQMKASGTAFISGKETAEYQKYEQQLDQVNDKLKQQVIRHQEASGKLDKYVTDTQKINVNWGKVGATIRRINTSINSMFRRLTQHLRQTEKGTNSTNISMKKLLHTILKYGFGIRSLYVLFNKFRAAVKEGLANFAEYSEEYKATTQDLKAATLTLKNSFATAFAPIIQFAIPYIKQLIQWLSTLMSYIAQFTAAITGQAKYTRAVEQTADALEKAGAAAEGYLSPIDTINKMNKDSGAGGVEGMFEEGAIDTKIAEFAQRFKDTIAELFAPLKKAWEEFGGYATKSWKKVITNIRKLIGDIGRDFKSVWTGSTMQIVFNNIVALLGDIGDLIAKIIDKIDAAWNANGERVLEAIAKLLETITRHFREFVRITKDWVQNVDINTLFERFAELLEALDPVAESVLGTLEDLYEKVLLKLAGWTLEEGLPKLLETLKDFVEKVDWDKLRQNLSDLWDHVEPFAERVGEGLILFIQDLSEKVADWVNSESFENLLNTIEKFLDSVSAEDIKDGIENIIKFVAAIKGLTLLAGLGSTIAKLGQLYSTMKQISLLTNLSKTVSVGVEADTAGAVAAGTSLGKVFAAAVLAAVAGFEVGKKLGAILFPEDAEYYKNFSWFGENGFFAAVKDWWDLIFIPGLKEWADGLKKDFEDYVDDCVKIFDDGADDLATVVNDGLNLIVSFLNGDFTSAWNNARKLASDCATAIKDAFDNVASVAADIPLIGEVFKTRFTWKGANGTSGGAHHGFATGGVIPPSAEEHLIKVGDNNTETEIVSPLSTIREAVSQALAGMGGAGSQPIVINQYLDGKQVAQAVVREGKLQQMSTGRNMFALG